ncbi:MAG: ParB N-terminal domain-containing protein [Chloroflexota bacterium]|nr:ParB N-terminal domain-containing protein [Chloroflexota bacterium]
MSNLNDVPPEIDETHEARNARGPYQLLPALTNEELSQLEASIRAHGIEDPVWVDEHDRTLDGHHRRAIGDRLGMPYEKNVVPGLSENEKRLFAIRRNTERRQLSKAQRALVGMRAEPSFRAEAKARQGARTDLSPNLAKGEAAEQRRVWAADEAARLVGLAPSTYRRYRAMIVEARGFRSPEEVDAAIESGRWDIGELRAVVEQRRQAEEQARQAKERAAQEERLRKYGEEEAAWWAAGGLKLGRTSDQEADADDLWRCDACDAYWPSLVDTCGRCGATRPSEAPSPSAQTVRTPWGPITVPTRDPVSAPTAPARTTPTPEPAQDVVAATPAPRALWPVSRLSAEASRDLYWLLPDRSRWHAKHNPEEVAPLVVAEWSPQRVRELREGVRNLLGWLARLDAALDKASFDVTPADQAEQDQAATH